MLFKLIYQKIIQDWALCFAFASPVILIDEILKFIARLKNDRELVHRLKQE
jgi:hypothetical protein